VPAVAGEDLMMNRWSNYLREQAELAERLSRTMPTRDLAREFEGYAASFRRDAEAEDNAPARHRASLD